MVELRREGILPIIAILIIIILILILVTIILKKLPLKILYKLVNLDGYEKLYIKIKIILIFI